MNFNVFTNDFAFKDLIENNRIIFIHKYYDIKPNCFLRDIKSRILSSNKNDFSGIVISNANEIGLREKERYYDFFRERNLIVSKRANKIVFDDNKSITFLSANNFCNLYYILKSISCDYLVFNNNYFLTEENLQKIQSLKHIGKIVIESKSDINIENMEAKNV